MINKKGFTIIELVVVIAIIAVLASVVTALVVGYLAAARNGRRTSDISNYTKAMSMYYVDNGKYPGATGAMCCLGTVANNGGDASCGNSCLANTDLQKYIPSLPALRIGVGSNGTYWYYNINNTKYSLYWSLEGLNQPCVGGFVSSPGLSITYCQYNSP